MCIHTHTHTFYFSMCLCRSRSSSFVVVVVGSPQRERERAPVVCNFVYDALSSSGSATNDMLHIIVPLTHSLSRTHTRAPFFSKFLLGLELKQVFFNQKSSCLIDSLLKCTLTTTRRKKRVFFHHKSII